MPRKRLAEAGHGGYGPEARQDGSIAGMTAKSPFDIRPLHPGDRAAWDDLWSRYLAFYDTRLPPAQHDTTFARLTDPDGGLHGRIALHDGRPAGLVHFLYHASTWEASGTCYLQDLYTDPDHRGTGIGRALIQSVCDHAAARGVATVYWLTADSNVTAQRLYDSVAMRTPFRVYERVQP
jgi:GNAT superfamily N-acetyltransferase